MSSARILYFVVVGGRERAPFGYMLASLRATLYLHSTASFTARLFHVIRRYLPHLVPRFSMLRSNNSTMATTKIQEPPILLLIDIQQGVVEGLPEFGPRSTPNFVENIKYLLQTWRRKSWPVLHVNHDDIADENSPINSKNSETFAFHSAAAPLDEEPVFTKSVGSPFVATELLGVIQSHGNRKVVVIGMEGGQCVNSTVRHGSDLGLEIVVVADACASYGADDWEHVGGNSLGAEETHRIAMGTLMGYAKVTSTKRLLQVLGYE